MEQNSHAAETGLLPQETIIIVKSKDPVWMDRLRPVVAEAIGLLIFVFIGEFFILCNIPFIIKLSLFNVQLSSFTNLSGYIFFESFRFKLHSKAQ